nr:mandelate racemase/muconate lactonizing enzyme family protein [uncultured Oscillibacter sp.]
MKITNVETVGLAYPTKKPFYNALGRSAQRACLLVRIYTDEGIVGVGEAAPYGGPLISTETVIRRELAPKLIGLDPMDVEYIWHRLFFEGYQHSRNGIFVCALSGVDMALWDIMGKALKQPIYKLLGGYRSRVKVYASGGFYGQGKSREELAAELKSYVQQGFDAVKMKVGRTFTPLTPRELSDGAEECALTFAEDLERVRVAREAVGDRIALMVDANAAWTYPDALQAGRVFDELNVYLFEEPLRTDDYEGSAQLASHLRTRVAGYETECLLTNFTRLIEGRCVDLVQPDISWAGGFTECRKIAAVAEAHCMEVAPHAFSSGILLAASLQFSAGLSNGAMVEFDMTENGLRTGLLKEPFIPKEGYIELDEKKYGLGIELNENVIEQYRVGK